MKKVFKWIGFILFAFVLFMSLTNHQSVYHSLGVSDALDTLNTTIVCFFIYVLFKDFLSYMKKTK